MICANILLYLNIHLYKQKKGKDQRVIVSYMEASAIWMLCLFLGTEILSCFHGINRLSLIFFWGVLDVVLLFDAIWRNREERKSRLCQCFPIQRILRYKPIGILLLIGLLVIVLALRTVPYNWDSMTYRLSRIAYWTQNGSVEHFATNCSRALANPPLGEFVQLHVYVLTGRSDYFLNLMQAFSYLTCAVMVYAIAKRLKCKDAFCFLAALLFMSMPIAFGEALNTQVDLFSGVWLLTFVYLWMDFMDSEEPLPCSGDMVFKACIVGLCVAWGYLSKPNVCVAMLLFALLLLVRSIVRKDKIGVLARLAVWALGSMLLPLAWEISRNLRTYHAISAPIAGARQLVGTLNPRFLFINFLKNFTYNLPCRYTGNLAEKMLSAMWQISTKLGVPLNAESISEDGGLFSYMAVPNYGHDTATNPIVVWLLIICIVGAVLRIRRIDRKHFYKSYSAVAFASFLAFCVIVRWEPFVTRYMLGFLALICPAIALQLQKVCGGKIWIQRCIVGLVSVLCMIEVIGMSDYHYDMCTLYGAGQRPYGYFANRSTEYEALTEIVKYIQDNGYTEIGIYHGGNGYEYPYWAMLKDDVSRIEHVRVTNESAIYIDTTYQPQCIIWQGGEPKEPFVWNGREYPNAIKIAKKRYVLLPD